MRKMFLEPHLVQPGSILYLTKYDVLAIVHRAYIRDGYATLELEESNEVGFYLLYDLDVEEVEPIIKVGEVW